MTEHKSIACLQICKFIIQITWHLIQHGAFQMHHLIMGQHQNIILTVSVAHGESHLVMVIFSEIWIQLHILQEIIHPAHIPLKSKAQPAIIHVFGHTRPCGRLLRDQQAALDFFLEDAV